MLERLEVTSPGRRTLCLGKMIDHPPVGDKPFLAMISYPALVCCDT